MKVSKDKAYDDLMDELVDKIAELAIKNAKEVTTLFREFHDKVCTVSIDQCKESVLLRDVILKTVEDKLRKRGQHGFHL